MFTKHDEFGGEGEFEAAGDFNLRDMIAGFQSGKPQSGQSGDRVGDAPGSDNQEIDPRFPQAQDKTCVVFVHPDSDQIAARTPGYERYPVLVARKPLLWKEMLPSEKMREALRECLMAEKMLIEHGIDPMEGVLSCSLINTETGDKRDISQNVPRWMQLAARSAAIYVKRENGFEDDRQALAFVTTHRLASGTGMVLPTLLRLCTLPDFPVLEGEHSRKAECVNAYMQVIRSATKTSKEEASMHRNVYKGMVTIEMHDTLKHDNVCGCAECRNTRKRARNFLWQRWDAYIKWRAARLDAMSIKTEDGLIDAAWKATIKGLPEGEPRPIITDIA